MNEGGLIRRLSEVNRFGMLRCNYGDSESDGLSLRTTFIFIGA